MDTLKVATPPLAAELKYKKFEVCFEKEPTQNEIYCLQQEAAAWQNHKVIKIYPSKTFTEKVAKFWVLSFDVEEKDWLFWCGFLAGKKWRLKADEREVLLKIKDNRAVEYLVQI